MSAKLLIPASHSSDGSFNLGKCLISFAISVVGLTVHVSTCPIQQSFPQESVGGPVLSSSSRQAILVSAAHPDAEGVWMHSLIVSKTTRMIFWTLSACSSMSASSIDDMIIASSLSLSTLPSSSITLRDDSSTNTDFPTSARSTREADVRPE